MDMTRITPHQQAILGALQSAWDDRVNGKQREWETFVAEQEAKENERRERVAKLVKTARDARLTWENMAAVTGAAKSTLVRYGKKGDTENE